jgi:uncharacterized membrane-anchored protein YhcB (DUF1043 family)
MKWDEKHDRAKRVIDAFLDNAEYWQEREDLTAELREEEKQLVDGEVALMIKSIRKRYKLQERLAEQKTEINPEQTEENKVEEKKETVEKQEIKPEVPEKPKRGRKPASGEKKQSTRKPRVKKEDKEGRQ